MRYLLSLAVFLLNCAGVFGFFFNFNQNGQQQGDSRRSQPQAYEDRVAESTCNDYLCPGTLECVKSPADCGCPFPKSQLRCVLPNGEAVCISKPSNTNARLAELYDDPIKGPEARIGGMRDCGWVLDAYNGVH